MSASTLLLVVLSFLAVLTRATSDEDVISYCKKSQLYPDVYGPTPTECCDGRDKCDMVIGPMETKYGLYNPDPKWPRRHCSCDRTLFNCVMYDRRSPHSQSRTNQHGFQYETCFREKSHQVDRYTDVVPYEFVSFLNSLTHHQ